MTEFQRIDYEPALLLPAAPASGEARAFIDLPRPRLDAGAPLMQALARRRSTRVYAETPVTLDTLGELLWAANGINRALRARLQRDRHLCRAASWRVSL